MSNLTSFSGSQWYVLYTRPKFERKVAEDILSLNYECYLPMTTSVRKWSDRMKMVREPLFKNYVFVKTAMYHKALFLQMVGVIRFVSIDGKPVPINEREMASIELIANNQQTMEYEPVYSYGDKIRVTSGAFLGMEGMLLKKIGKTRLLIRMPLLNQAISVEVAPEDIVRLT